MSDKKYKHFTTYDEGHFITMSNEKSFEEQEKEFENTNKELLAEV